MAFLKTFAILNNKTFHAISAQQALETLNNAQMKSTKIMTRDQQSKQFVNHSFKQFRLGFSIFFLGFVILYCNSVLLTPSLAQELVALISLSLIGMGFILVVVTEVRFLLFRGIQFFTEKNQ